MADKKPSRRPIAGSRIPSRSPKRLAGQPARLDLDPEIHEDAADDTADEQAAPGVLQKPRTTRVLLVLVAVAALVAAGFAILQFQDEGDAQSSGTVWAPVSKPGEFKPPRAGEIPVTVDSLEWTKAVDDIAHSVTKMLSFNHETIDTQDDLAADLVTPEFLENDLKQTFAETAPKLKESKAEYTVTVAAQSVISATDDRVRALLFVNQLVTKGSGDDAVSDNYPLRLDVEGVLVDGEWLISDLNAG